MSYKTYNNYKDSKIDWIKEIPDSWSISRVKNISLIKSGESPNFDDNGQYDVIGANGKIGQTNIFNISTCHIIIGRVGASGSVNISPEFAFISDNAFILTLNKNIDLKYSFYLFKALDMDRLINKNAQPLLTATQIKNLFIPYTTLNEQKQIAKYLDKKTAKIDATIAKNEELIQLLEEKRVALINQVVTKGLNPDVPMKDSGVEWIGEIPEHWDVTPLKRFVKLHNGKEINNEVKEDDEDAIGVYGSGGLFKYTDEYLFKGESVLFGRKGTLGKPLYLNDIFWTVDTMYYLSFNKYLLPKYCYYYLTFYPWNKISTETAKPSVVGSDVTNSMFAIPDIVEQKQIADYLDTEITKLNQTVNKIQENINLLEEYKTSLIHHVVTGKIDVREEVI